MKKMLVLLLAMLMLCTAAFAEGAVDYTGLWTMTGGVVNGQSYTDEQLGMELTMELREDGTCILTISDEAENGTWVAAENGVTVTDATDVAQTFTLEEGKLVAEEEGMKIIFSRAAAGADYVDTWIAITLESGGQTIDLLSQGLVMSLTLNEDGTCVLDASGVPQDGTWAVTDTGITTTDADGIVDVYTLTDGKLSAEAEGMKIVFARESEVALAEENTVDVGVPEEDLYAQPMSGLTAEAFNGVWTLSWANAMNEVYTKDALGMNIEIQIMDGMGYVKEVSGADTYEYFGVTQIEEIADLGTVMYLLFVDETGAQSGAGMVFFMFDNGQIVWEAQYEDGSWILWYFDQVIVEETPADAASVEVPVE